MKLDPDFIQKKSFSIIEKEVSRPKRFDDEEWRVVRRMIHASADFDLLDLVLFHKDAIKSGVKAIKNGCYIITDTKMALAGINKQKAKRLSVKLRCFINKKEVKEIAEKKNITRAMASADFSLPLMEKSIYVIGNAPTFLMRLLELIKQERTAPHLIVGMPVGFVNVVESKELLLSQNEVPYITVKGRKGGTTLAVAVINELFEIAIG